MSVYSVGSIVSFRGREWIIESNENELLTLRPLSGGFEDRCAAYLPLEGNNLRPASFPAPTVNDIGDFRSARLLRDAARLLLRMERGRLDPSVI